MKYFKELGRESRRLRLTEVNLLRSKLKTVMKIGMGTNTKNTIALLIPEVSQAIIDEYKEETIRCPTTPDEWRLIANKFENW